MTDIAISITTKVTEYLVEPIKNQGQYLFCVSKLTKNLEEKKGELTLTRNSVQNRVQEDKKKTMKIENAVEKWLNDVKNVIEEVENLQKEIQANDNCFPAWCPTWRRYCLCKQMAKKTEIITKLNDNSKFEQFPCLASLPGIEYFSYRDFGYFESTKLAYNELLEAIQDERIHIIGLYGMGGCGKTTLAKEVGRKAKELNLFDRVILVTVSQNPNIRNIQGEIADMLNLNLGYESVMGRAQQLWTRMKDEKHVLVILDDVWAKIKLEDIGIPHESDNIGCKILLTTRRQQVCSSMECQIKIQLHLLSDEEAWTLFQKHSGLDGASSSILLNELAGGIVSECKGLPLAIAAVGTSLRGKSNDDWNIALHKLKHSKPVDVEKGEEDVYGCLKLSYDYLRPEFLKSLFKMCALFPEDHEISEEDLFRYGVGLGLCEEFESFVEARRQVNSLINKLICSCLLIESDEQEGHMKMHDVVRDVALWIESQEDHAILVNQKKAYVKKKMEDCFALSSWDQEIDQVPNEMDATKIEIRLLCNGFREPFNVSFGSMKQLKVMGLMNEFYRDGRLILSLPESTHSLTTLRILRLEGWQLGDISWVINLHGLEVLDLQSSQIKELPKGIEKLNKLKLLDLSHCGIENNEEDCYQVIRRCSQLEELYAFIDWRPSNLGSVDSDGYSLEGASFPELQRYELQIGKLKSPPPVGYIDDRRRFMYIGYLPSSAFGPFTKDLLRRATALLIQESQGYKNFIPEVVQAFGAMNELTMLQLYDCREMEYLIDTTSHQVDSPGADVVLPRLVHLEMLCMFNLKQVCCGPLPLYFFDWLQSVFIKRCRRLFTIFPRECSLCNLKILSIAHCPQLTFLFPMSVAGTLAQLEKLSIDTSDNLKQIITHEGEEISIVSENSLLMFPKLKCLEVSLCPMLEYALPMSCVKDLVQLETMFIQGCENMEYVFGEDEHHRPSSYDIQFPLLKKVSLWDLDNLLRIFPEEYHFKCPSLSLRALDVIHCDKFEASGINTVQN